MNNEPEIRRAHKIFVESDTGMYGAKVIAVQKNHYRVQTYYTTGLPYRHNVPKNKARLQDGQY